MASYEELPEDVEEEEEEEILETDGMTTLRFLRGVTMFVISLMVYNLIKDGTYLSTADHMLYLHFKIYINILLLLIVLLAGLRFQY